MPDRDQISEQDAKRAADDVRRRLHLTEPCRVGLVLGTGWGSALPIENPQEMPFGDIQGFAPLRELKGHARKVVCGRVAGVPIAALSGRIHLNERPNDGELARKVRLQTEMLIQLGAEKLILTCAAGSLPESNTLTRLEVGDICVVDGFVTLFAPDLPMYGGEFVSPEDTLDPELRNIALIAARETGLEAQTGGHVMVRGPQFEGRQYDKKFLASTGARIVGMSVLPEACVASLYPNVKVLTLAFITNDAFAAHSHEENLARAKASSAKLGDYLTRIVSKIA